MSETTVVQPAAGQAVIRTGDHDGHRRRDDDIERLILAQMADGFRQSCSDHTDSMKQSADVASDVIGSVQASRSDVMLGMTNGFAAAQRSICDSTSELKSTVLGSARDVKDAVVSGSASALAAICGVSHDVAASREQTVVGFKDAQALAYQIEGRSALNGERIGNAAAVQATNNFNLTTVQVERTRSELSAQADRYAADARYLAQTHASAAELRAQQIAAEAAKQLADCCCDLKELTRAEHVQTRALIDSVEKDRLRAELSDAKSALLSAKLEEKICCGCAGESRRRGPGGPGNN